MSRMSDTQLTLGALLAGGLIAVALSGLVALQTFLYFRLYPNDSRACRYTVIWIWLLDAAHTCLISAALWWYLISNLTNRAIVQHIYAAIPVTVTLTAVTTTSANFFYVHRVWKLSGEKWITSVPIVFLSLARLAFALVSTVKMAEVMDFQIFAHKYKPIFTTGLALSAAMDILIASILCYFLRVQRDGLSSTKQMIDTIIVITINNGALTCAVAVAALVCMRIGPCIHCTCHPMAYVCRIQWVSMSNSLVYVGLHFCIGKLYANSLLATLNMRNWLRYRKTPDPSGSYGRSDQIIAFSDDPRNKIHTDAAVRRYVGNSQMSPTPATIAAARPLEISVCRRSDMIRSETMIDDIETTGTPSDRTIG